MIKKLFMAGLLMAFLTTATHAFAESVYVTPNGKKYHKKICRLIKKKDSMIELEKKQAVEENYGPCKRCFKEDIADEQ